jgi:hypothetical protein
MTPTPFSSVACKCTHNCTTNSFAGFVIGPEPPAAVSRTVLTQFRTELVHFHFLLHEGKSRDCADLRKCDCIIKLIRLSKTAVFKRLSIWLLGKASKRNENIIHGSQDLQMTSRAFHVSWHNHFRVISFSLLKENTIIHMYVLLYYVWLIIFETRMEYHGTCYGYPDTRDHSNYKLNFRSWISINMAAVRTYHR